MFQDIIKRFRNNYRLQKALYAFLGFVMLICCVEFAINGYFYMKMNDLVISDLQHENQWLRDMRALEDSVYQHRFAQQEKQIEALKAELANRKNLH